MKVASITKSAGACNFLFFQRIARSNLTGRTRLA